MQVFITGGTGYIGGAVAEALVAAGHRVRALAPTPELADAARALGAEAALGDLRDIPGLAAHAAGVDAVIHAANTGGPDAAAVDEAATRALLGALAGSQRPFIYTSGAWVLGATHGRFVDESSPRKATRLIRWREALEAEILGTPATHAVIVRPGIVFGDEGGIPGMVARGDLPVVGDGRQRWPLVHRRDLAALYLRALEAPAGSILHGVALHATMREVALLGASRRGATLASVPLDAARATMGDFADALALDQLVSSDRTKALTGWTPTRTSIVEALLGDLSDQRQAAA